MQRTNANTILFSPNSTSNTSNESYSASSSAATNSNTTYEKFVPEQYEVKPFKSRLKKPVIMQPLTQAGWQCQSCQNYNQDSVVVCPYCQGHNIDNTKTNNVSVKVTKTSSDEDVVLDSSVSRETPIVSTPVITPAKVETPKPEVKLETPPQTPVPTTYIVEQKRQKTSFSATKTEFSLKELKMFIKFNFFNNINLDMKLQEAYLFNLKTLSTKFNLKNYSNTMTIEDLIKQKKDRYEFNNTKDYKENNTLSFLDKQYKLPNGEGFYKIYDIRVKKINFNKNNNNISNSQPKTDSSYDRSDTNFDSDSETEVEPLHPVTLGDQHVLRFFIKIFHLNSETYLDNFNNFLNYNNINEDHFQNLIKSQNKENEKAINKLNKKLNLIKYYKKNLYKYYHPLLSTGWILNNSLTCCFSCSNKFNFITNPRHHCRACGNLVCSTCSSNELFIKKYESLGKQRVCSGCFFKSKNGIVNRVNQSGWGESIIYGKKKREKFTEDSDVSDVEDFKSADKSLNFSEVVTTTTTTTTISPKVNIEKFLLDTSDEVEINEPAQEDTTETQIDDSQIEDEQIVDLKFTYNPEEDPNQKNVDLKHPESAASQLDSTKLALEKQRQRQLKLQEKKNQKTNQ